MDLSISKTILIRLLVGYNHSSKICLLSVRRNASTISSEPTPSLSDTSSCPLLESSKREAVHRKNRAAAIALLRQYGFTDAHISKLEIRSPNTYRFNSQNNISIKFKFLESIGLSRADIPVLVVRNPYLLSSSVEKKLIPSYNYFKNLSISQEQINRMLKTNSRILTGNLEKTVVPNVELLRDMGLPLSIITYCVTYYSLAIGRSHALFKSSVARTIEMGFDLSKKMFIVAIHVLCGVNEQTWAKKMEVFRRFGMSDDVIMLAFRTQPKIMLLSEKNIAKGLEFFLKELGWDPTTLASNPFVLQYSFEKRVIPRCRVVESLREKGLAKLSLLTILVISEEKFVKYIHSLKDFSSELMDIYKRDVSSRGETS